MFQVLLKKRIDKKLHIDGINALKKMNKLQKFVNPEEPDPADRSRSPRVISSDIVDLNKAIRPNY